MERLAVERSIWLNAPPERVWHVVTEPKHLVEWYAPGCIWEIPTLQVGAAIRFYNTDTDVQPGTIEVVNPLRQFSIRWRPDQAYPEVTLINTFLLEVENGGTRVTVTQAGYESLPDNVRQAWYDADSGAYTTIMENLKVYLQGA
jgi:uncharacterized protein YndB with AHSA1/START domain